MGSYTGNDLNNYFKAHKERPFIFKKWKSWKMSGNGGNDTLIGGPKNDKIYNHRVV
ncbi:MAG: hypothetical protein F6K50_18775 [Moorea sp. SIO3I7]|uniref:hypothetical protein n=1 Tax=Moorena sp. SIO3I8 TaxID=2607833 RepID=UPI0013C25B88|nr:hypothetical protein [Moorena sp. SIO3I8]NEN97494.1 hypothetical protein [Moorena sp. SIO3I7]NEO09948.1 hypothetical protein [Moorena sp. SIO3I8]